MNKNEILRWAALAALALTGCANETTTICGQGDEIAVDGQAYCVYRSAVVVENGFECPPERPNLIQDGGIGVCSPQQTLPGETLERIGREYREVDPTYEGCILDFECDAGEVCRPNGCTVPSTNNTNVSPNNATNNTTGTTNNTTGTTNNGSTCATSADCTAGQVCEDGACVGACGGFAGFVCTEAEWCDYPDGSICGAADMLGTCRPRPEACIELFDPVCGCDGMDYSNSCDASAGGTDVASTGTCN